MNRTHVRIFRIGPALGLVAAALLIAPTSGLAANATATGTISGSTLSLATSASPSFSANLDNGDSTPTYTVPLTTQDTRGSGAGWNETITSTQFNTGAPNNYTLDTAASTVTGVTQSGISGTNTAPTNSITYPLGVPAGASAPSAVKLYNAASGTGMGRFTVTPTIGVFVPQNSFAGTYTSTLTLGLVSGP
jgi:hypothetical protein